MLIDKIEIIDIGLINYEDAYSYQKNVLNNVMRGGRDALMFCQHPATITCGRMTNMDNLYADKSMLEKYNIQVHKIDRGGDITLHSPGQLVIYPIVNLANIRKDIKFFIRNLEQIIVKLLNSYGLGAGVVDGKTGVWINNDKISSIGIGVKKWITYHGISLNINNDLSLFSLINPCGLNIKMTSLSKEINQKVSEEEVKKKFADCFIEQFFV